MTKPLFMVLFAGLFFISTSKVSLAGNDLTRENAPANQKWDLTAIYPSWTEWKADLDRVSAMADQLVSYQGKIGASAENLLAVLKLNEEISKIGTKVYCYPYLFRSIDSRNQEVNAHFQEAMIMFSRLGTQMSWITPEMLTIPEETAMKWVNENPAFSPYRFDMVQLYRQQKHVLDQDKEKLMSYFSITGNTPESIYTELSTSDIKFPEVTFSDGQTLKLTQGNYTKVLTFNKNQEDRKKAYEKFMQVYKDYENTYAAILNGVYQADWASTQARNYSSFLESCLFPNNIPEKVYLNLIETAKSNTAPFRRYLELRKKALGLKEYNAYDGSISLSSFDKEYPYDEARKMVFEAVAPLGKDYQDKLNKAISGGWIDVYEGEGKESGAYSLNVYGTHPYILLNYNQTMDYVFTLAHELGHSMHSVYSSETQPYATNQYTSFVAEVASIFNEELMLDYMLKHSKDPNERIALLDQAISNIVGTFYRQCQFADFEYQARTMVEKGMPINVEVLNGIADSINNAYYGNCVVPNQYRNIYWTIVSHFYELKYYVYQYATSYAAASYLSQKITTGSKKERQDAVDRYLTLLKSGGNDYPIEQLKKAGVDMTEQATFNTVVNRLDQLVSQLENELKNIDKL